MLCLVNGFISIMKTKSLKPVGIFAIILLFANLIYEWAIPLLNTPDLVDAYYGFVGTILPFLYFYFYKNFGFNPNPKYLSEQNEYI